MAFKRDELINELCNLGFQKYETRCSTWMYALVATNTQQTIYILIRKRGVDFKIYNEIKETKTDEYGKLFTEGGEIIRNYYTDSNVNLHNLAVKIANSFLDNEYIDANNMTSYGKPNNKRKYKNEMEELYDDLCVEDGEDVYLSDGVWLSSDGSMHER